MDYKHNEYVKVILLKGKGLKEEIIEINNINSLHEIYNCLDSKNEYHMDINNFTFGGHEKYHYEAIWNTEKISNTCMEITCYAGVSFPIFIDSQVIIICHCYEEGGYLIDVNIDEVKKYFNTENSFWALMKV